MSAYLLHVVGYHYTKHILQGRLGNWFMTWLQKVLSQLQVLVKQETLVRTSIPKYLKS